MNNRCHITVLLKTTPISFYCRIVHYKIYLEKKNLTITISSHQASCKYRKKKEKQGTRTPNKVQNATTKVLKNTKQRPCTKYSRSFTQPFVRETGNISASCPLCNVTTTYLYLTEKECKSSIIRDKELEYKKSKHVR